MVLTTSSQQTVDELLEQLKKLHPNDIDLSLDRLEVLLQRCGSPERQLPPCVHVAGTNGKGSTVAFVRAGLEAAMLRVHAYTSPHLVRFNERIRVASEIISDEKLSELLQDILRINGGDSITFFEATTCAAFVAFARSTADYALLEVGMGGRTDATNVAGLAPSVCIITPISLDHTEFLGSTIELVAAEKAGILRPGVPAVVAHQHAAVLRVIQQRAQEIGCPLHVCGLDWEMLEEKEECGGGLVFHDLRTGEKVPLPRPFQLLGGHQIGNAGVACCALRLLGHGPLHILESALRTANWPARMQKLEQGAFAQAVTQAASSSLLRTMPSFSAEVWLDGGHNVAAGAALASALTTLGTPGETTHMFVVGMLRTKDAQGFLAPLRALGRILYAVPIPSEGPRALSATETAAAARNIGFDATEAETPLDAVRAAVATAVSQGATRLRIVICGSLYLAGDVLTVNAGSQVAAGPHSGSAVSHLSSTTTERARL